MVAEFPIMKNQQGVYQEKDYNFKEVTKALGLDYDQLKKSGEIDKVLQSGVSSALNIKIQGNNQVNGQTLVYETSARLSLGIDKNGRKVIQPILKSAELEVDNYQGIKITQEQQQELRSGKTIVIKEPNSEREIVVSVDKKLNKIGGWKKASILIPQEIGNNTIGTQSLEPKQQAALKRGEVVQVEMKGVTYNAKMDPVERTLKLTVPQKLDLKLDQKVGKKPKLRIS